MKTKTVTATFIAAAAVTLMTVGQTSATDITMRISGEGAINDSTIAVGKPVSLDIYWANDKERRGFTTGFSISSKTIKKIVHVKDTMGGLNENGDIKGHNGWEDKSIWDLGGIFAAMSDWDGELPDNVGFGAAVVKKRYLPHENMKVLSMEIIVPETGTIVVDSAFFAPGGYWKFGSGDVPTWDGPHVYEVVKAPAAKAEKKAGK